MKKTIIVAVSENNVIGKDGKIPWHSKAELRHFKETTMGYPIIMGRKTFESIGKVLPGRLNIVLSRNKFPEKEVEGLKFFSSLEDALEFCESEGYQKAFIIGGESVYRKALPITDEIVMTRMKLNINGDTFFPPIDFNDWILKSKKEQEEFDIEVYERKR